MSKRSIGSLADLAKILEAASDPMSELREDRKESTPEKAPEKPESPARIERPVDPKRKAWYERRLREQAEKSQSGTAPGSDEAETPVPAQTIARSTATKLSGSVLETLANAQVKKDKKVDKDEKDEKKKRPEAWRRKPGDPIF